MLPHFGRQAIGPLCGIWLQDNPHCPVGYKWLEPRNCSGLDVRPWQQKIIALARKVNQMGWFFSFNPKDSTQLHFLSLPGKKTVWKRERRKRGGVGNSWGHLDWTGLKDPEGCFLYKKKKKKKIKKQLRLILDIKLYFGLCLDCVQSHKIPQSCFLWVIGNAFAKL